MILPPTSQIGHHHIVTNITMSSTSLSPNGVEILDLKLSRRLSMIAVIEVLFGNKQTQYVHSPDIL